MGTNPHSFATISEAYDQFMFELNVLRHNAESGARAVHAFKTLHLTARGNPEIEKAINVCPAFWIAIESGLMIDSIMAMARIFDDANGSHNVNRLFAIAAGNLGLFSKEALATRKQGNKPQPPDWLDEYLEDVFEPSSSEEFKPLRKQVYDFRTIYVDKYKDIRDRCLAHHLFVDENERWRLFQRTNTDEMAEFFACFIRVCDALSGLLQNGTHPVTGQFQEWTEWQREEITEATSKTLLMLLPSNN